MVTGVLYFLLFMKTSQFFHLNQIITRDEAVEIAKKELLKANYKEEVEKYPFRAGLFSNRKDFHNFSCGFLYKRTKETQEHCEKYFSKKMFERKNIKSIDNRIFWYIHFHRPDECGLVKLDKDGVVIFIDAVTKKILFMSDRYLY
ncbi:hypothetical protein JXR93_00855 [bacterium]|nr:hypothetical protein [bacterium]